MSDGYSFVDAVKDTLKGDFSDAELAAKRYDICKACEFFKHATFTCAQCGCFMPAKTKLRGASCPVNKW